MRGDELPNFSNGMLWLGKTLSNEKGFKRILRREEVGIVGELFSDILKEYVTASYVVVEASFIEAYSTNIASCMQGASIEHLSGYEHMGAKCMVLKNIHTKRVEARCVVFPTEMAYACAYGHGDWEEELEVRLSKMGYTCKEFDIFTMSGPIPKSKMPFLDMFDHYDHVMGLYVNCNSERGLEINHFDVHEWNNGISDEPERMPQPEPERCEFYGMHELEDLHLYIVENYI